jgi:hypothetical protein
LPSSSSSFLLLVLPLLLSLLLSPSKDPIVLIVDVPPHAIAGSDGNHGDNCPAGGLIRLGETKEDVSDDEEGCTNVV